MPGSGSSAGSKETFYQDTLEAGRWINQPALVSLLAGNIAQEVRNLHQIGVVFLKDDLHAAVGMLRWVMSRYGFVLRNKQGLLKALNEVRALRTYLTNIRVGRSSLINLMSLKNAVYVSKSK